MRPATDGGGGGNSLGMDPGLGKQQAETLEQQGKKIKQAQQEIDTLMGELKTTWFGEDADRYQNKWNSDYSAQLTQAAQRLTKVAGQVRDQAREQQRGSA